MKKVFILPLAVLLVLFFSKCTLQEDLNKLKESLDSLQIVIANPEFSTYAHIEFRDAKTDDYISGKTITVTIDGKNAAAIFNNLGSKQTSYTTKVGFIDFIIDPHAVDTTKIGTDPLEFTVTTSIDGYVDATQKVIISHTKLNTAVVKLINITSAPAGVTVAVNNNFTTTLSGVVANTGTQLMNGGQQSVAIPKGTVLKDETGNILSGTVKTEIVYFDPTSDDAVDAFPGGSNVSVVMNNQEEQVQFLSAGMFDVDVTAGGNDVKTLTNGGITLKTVLPKGFMHPKLGRLVQAGDVIELWSLDEGNGEWKFEKMDTVRQSGTDLVLEETVKHLSSWNWDWYYSTCTYGPKFIFKGNITGNNNYASVVATANNGSFTKSSSVKVDPNDYWYDNLQLYYTPSNTPTTVTFTDAGGDPGRPLTFSPSSINISNLCSGQTYEITVNQTIVPTNEITVNLNLSATSATNTQILVRPSAIFYYRTPTSNWNYFYLTNGQASINLRTGVNYTIYGYFGNNSGTANLKIDKTGETTANVTFTPNINFSDGTLPQSITVPATISNNVINVVYTAVLPDNILSMLQ
jgi:hypothetical protein